MLLKLLKGPSGQHMFKKSYFDLEFLKGDKSSLLLNTKITLIPSFFGRLLVYSPLFPFAGALLFDEKIRQKSAVQVIFRTHLRNPKLSFELKSIL
jgi:hypothetical protein